jgi:UDP-GlcNAc3NAcA epimerase
MTKPIKVITVVGARPQFIKAAALSRAICANFAGRIEERIVHTGQHFDDNMSKVFFDDLGIPQPHYHFAISGGNHGAMTGKMLEAVENVLLQEKPDWLLVYGDTNSTLAGALAASKLHIPVAHVEAGLRSFNMRMPEEINRIVSDRVASLLFCPTQTAVENLAAEGIVKGVHNVGDVMYDVALYFKDKARAKSAILQQLKVRTKAYALATCHRAENTDDQGRLKEILAGLSYVSTKMPVVFPLHPRTRKLIQTFGLQDLLAQLIVTEPLPFLDMVALEQDSALILTDSGGVQKEAFFYGVPCITMRDETEWVETVQLGWNQLTGASGGHVINAVDQYLAQLPDTVSSQPYGNGNASMAILNQMVTA